MENAYNPLHYFEDLVTTDKINQLKHKFISEGIENLENIEEIDYEKGTIKYWSIYNDETNNSEKEGFITISFETNFNREIRTEFLKSKKELDKLVYQITYNGTSPNEFIKIQIGILDSLLLKRNHISNNYPNVENAIVGLKTHLNSRYLSTVRSSRNIINISTINRISFKWDGFNEEDSINQIKKLYLLLTQNEPIIIADEQEFINAFTQKNITNGIAWQLKTRNDLTSNSSLCYFIDSLEKETYIEEFPNKDFGKKLKYVFRKSDGTELTSLKQSISDFRLKLTSEFSDRIDDIINNI